jgi:hypothetical protein
MIGSDVRSNEPSRDRLPQGPSVPVDAWAASDWSDGVQTETCRPFERLFVRLHHNVYELIMLNGDAGDLLLRGGRFPQSRRVRLVGSTACGSMLKLLGIYLGLHMVYTWSSTWMASAIATQS